MAMTRGKLEAHEIARATPMSRPYLFDAGIWRPMMDPAKLTTKLNAIK